ncbi:hypothetical protein C8R43DRAFT_943423 [Mycena crocata]|nr:hypothetical protein C8R43DRAFT_943423 [Mycena crocata]
MWVHLFGRQEEHRCPHNPDLMALFPYTCYAAPLLDYLTLFRGATRKAPTMVQTFIVSIEFCRTRSSTSYPFLIVEMRTQVSDRPVRMKLEGFDSPRNQAWVSIASVMETLSELVGTSDYDILYGLAFPRRPTIVDLLTLAEVSSEWSHTREGFPSTLFLALIALFPDGTVSARAGADPLPRGIPIEAKSAVIDAFPARRQGMHDDIDARSTYCSHLVGIKGLRAHNDELREKEALLEERITRLGLVVACLGDSRTAAALLVRPRSNV